MATSSEDSGTKNKTFGCSSSCDKKVSQWLGTWFMQVCNVRNELFNFDRGIVDIPRISIVEAWSFCEGNWWDCGIVAPVEKQRNKGCSHSCLGCLQTDSRVWNTNWDRPLEYFANCFSILATFHHPLQKKPLFIDMNSIKDQSIQTIWASFVQTKL
jgi:hypothetical protein